MTFGDRCAFYVDTACRVGSFSDKWYDDKSLYAGGGVVRTRWYPVHEIVRKDLETYRAVPKRWLAATSGLTQRTAREIAQQALGSLGPNAQKLARKRTFAWFSMVDNRPLWIQNVSVRIVKEAFLVQAGRAHPKAAGYLETWRQTVKEAKWRNPVDVRRSYPATDAVRVESGRRVLVFNVCSNEYRLIVAAHFNREIVYTLRFLTHAEYSKDRWKDTL